MKAAVCVMVGAWIGAAAAAWVVVSGWIQI